MLTEIIYEDPGILVVRKPAGLAAQASSDFQMDMDSELKNYISNTSGVKNPYLALVHRLDQPVEGLLVVAKTRRAAAALQAQLTDGMLRKKYLAVLTSIPAKKSSILVNYLKKSGKSNLSIIVSENEKGAKRAELHYRIVAEEASRALADIVITTGRHHQIRVQMADIGCPLLGDSKYGHPAAGERQWLALCANILEFNNPLTKKRQRFEIRPENPAFLQFKEYIDKNFHNGKQEGENFTFPLV